MSEERNILLKYYNLWNTGNDAFFMDDKFISFVYNFDIHKHPRKINDILYFLICQCLNKYLKIAYEVYIYDINNFYSTNADNVLFIPTEEAIKRDALNHIQEEYIRVIEEHPIFKKTKEIKDKYNLEIQQEIKIYTKNDPFIPKYLIPEGLRQF